MEKRLMTFIACLFLSIGMALAQTQVSGTVTSSEDGSPVIGASIKVVGTNTGTVTNIDGNFSLNVSANAKLEVSYIGMVTKTVKAAKNMKIVLDTDNHSLDEVMVVAYGTAKKSAFTGSAAVVKSDDIAKVQVSNPVDALVGKVSGVQLYNNSGQPGVTTPSINIRGVGSINAGTSPLVIVDGAPYDGDLNSISNQDIESMTVLKDAASAALYGARGANGVILITTKNANKGVSSITVDAKWGSNSRALPNYYTVDSPAKYYEMWYEGLYNYAKNGFGYSNDMAAKFANTNLTSSNDYGLGYNVYTIPSGEYLIGSNGKLNPNATLGRVVEYDGQQYYLTPDDWTKAAYQNGLRQEYTVSANGATDKSNFYASINYLNNEGITMNSNYKRFTARLKADYQLRSWLKVAGNFTYTHHNMNYLNTDTDGDSNDSGNIFALTQMAPIYPLYIRDGEGNIMYDNVAGIKRYDYGNQDNAGLTRPFMTYSNPLSDNQLNILNDEGSSLNATGSAEIRFLKDFKFTSVNTVTMDESRGTHTVNPYYGQHVTSNGIVNKGHGRTWAYNYQQLLNWGHSFGLNNVEAMLGHEYYRRRFYTLSGSKSNQFSTGNSELAGAVIAGSQNSYTTDYNVEGFFGRALYNWNERYFGSVSFRRDASSRFAKENRWGNFWSFGGAWLISKEKWFNVDWVDELKFKASYGEQGNDNIGDYLYTNTYSISNSNNEIATVPASLGNKDITWEKNGNFNTGFEFTLLKSRLSGSIEYFYRKTSDMLFYFPLAPSFGYTGYYANIGDMRNSGVEIELNGDIISNKDLKWSAHLNLTAYKNKITKLPEERRSMTVDGVQGYSSSEYFFGQGESIYTFYLKKYAGVDENTGKALYWMDTKDANGNVTGQEKTDDYSKATYHLCGTALPDVYGGFGTSVSWKGFDLSVEFAYQLGGKVYDSTYQSEMSFTRGMTFHSDMQNAWTPDNTKTNVPRMQYGDKYTASTSDRWLTSASYLSLQNINLSYTLPKSLISRIGLQNLRLYVTGDNLWLWSKRQGLDPRQSIAGSSTSAYYSPIRTISGGLSVTF